MIEFVTLFLGLVSGPQMVELQADTTVLAVELRLDGEMVATLGAPPWEAEVDLGPELLPRRLTAVALDAAGEEISRATQWLNVPRSEAEVTLLLEHDDDGRPVAVRVAWETTLAPTPVAISAQLNGRELEVEDPRRVDLGRVDPTRFNFLEVVLEFDGGVVARAQLAFGGAYTGTTDAALTAFPISRRWRGTTPDLASMSVWFAGEHEPVRVVAVDKGPADIIVLRAPEVLEAMIRLKGLPDRSQSPGSGNASLGPAHLMANASPSSRLQQALRFDRSHRPRLMSSRSRRASGETLRMEQFPISPELSPGAVGMYGLLSKEVVIPGLSNETRLWDAAAVAVLQVAGSNRRRGVVVVLAGGSADRSHHDSVAVRRFAERLNVPLFVWCLESELEPTPECSDVAGMSTFKELRQAMRSFTDELDSQRIVWLEGSHAPTTIQLTPAARATSVIDLSP